MKEVLMYLAVIVLLLVAGLIFSVPSVKPEYGVVYLESAPSEENKTGGGLGSGFFIGENLLVTNAHVINLGPNTPISDGKKYKVYAYDDRTPYSIEVVFNDPLIDLAFFKIVDWEEFKERERYTVLKIEKTPIKEGDQVYALGSPYGIRGFRSEGVLGAINRLQDTESGRFSFGHYVTAFINPGNSGGPIVNNEGNVVGVSELKGMDYFFAISGDFLANVLDQFNTSGKFVFATSKSMFDTRPEDGEFVITAVGDDQYKEAGFKVGDTIQAIHSDFTRKYGTDKIWTAQQIVAYTKYMTKPGEVIVIDVERDGIIIPLTVKM